MKDARGGRDAGNPRVAVHWRGRTATQLRRHSDFRIRHVGGLPYGLAHGRREALSGLCKFDVP